MAAHPERLGKYEIRREIGKGSMGVVFEAYDAVIQRRVAIKMIRRDDFGSTQGSDLVARLKREAQAAGRLNHAGIVAIHDYGEEPDPDGHPVAYIAMEFIEGTDLRRWLDAGRVRTPAQAAIIVTAILQALQHAHERGVTHRDIKPANVFMLPDGTVKLADFGVARIEASELTQAGTIIGTPMYMSPEQILGLAVDGRSDLFSCGVLLYELLTGTPPFSGSVATVIRQVLEVDPDPPSRRMPSLGPAWDPLMARALAKKPEQRPATAREMAAELSQAMAEAGTGDADATVVLTPPAATAPARQPPTPATSDTAAANRGLAPAAAPGATPTPTPAPGRLLPLFAAIAGFGAIAVGGFYVAWRGNATAPGTIATPIETVVPAQPPGPAAAPPPGATRAVDAGASASLAASGNVASIAAPARAEPASAAAPAVVPTIPKRSTSASAAPAAPAPSPPAAAAAPPRAADRPPGEAARATGPAIAAGPAPRPTTAAAATVAPFDWADRVSPARFESVPVPNRLTAAMRRLLEPLHERDAERLQEFDALLAEQRRPFAYALGVRDGRFVHAWAQGVDAAAAASAAQRLCAERARGRFCPTVQVNATFLRSTFLVAARQLGTESPAAVRSAWMRTVEEAIRELRLAPAAAAAPTPAPAPAPAHVPAPAPSSPPSPAVGASTPPAPAGAWTRARSRLREASPQGLADGFATLLDVQSPDDRRRLDRLQTEVRRLRWKSALAVGVSTGGTLTWNTAQGESRTEWAEDRALADCASQVPAPGCVIVAGNGDLRAVALSTLASRLGSRPQAEVREAFLRSIGRRWP
ncbi:MAG: serine/threonine protein kinase [Rubrivivax sp.]|nr:serine/threonine protein kinase [Rubrivivax sp.]